MVAIEGRNMPTENVTTTSVNSKYHGSGTHGLIMGLAKTLTPNPSFKNLPRRTAPDGSEPL